MKMCCWAASDYFGLEINEQRLLESDAEKDQAIDLQMQELSNWIQFTGSSEGAITRKITTSLGIDTDQAERYFMLRERGFDTLEAISLLWGAKIVPWLRPEMRDRIPEGWKYNDVWS